MLDEKKLLDNFAVFLAPFVYQSFGLHIIFQNCNLPKTVRGDKTERDRFSCKCVVHKTQL